MKIILYFMFPLTMSLLETATAQDSLNVLSAKQVMNIVKQYHPVAKMADINIEKAKADITLARGMFDPVLKNESAQKIFDGTDYYYYNRPELSIPTWFGIEVSAGLEYLSGDRTDPADTKGKTSYFGINAPLAKNLLMDKRRAALQTAKLLKQASELEKKNILNNLLLEATQSYWTWAQQYQVFKILSEAVAINEKRVEWVKTASQLGDRPAIDTLEAISQLQSMELLKSQAWLEFQNAGLDLSVYLWTPQSLPYNLPGSVRPADELSTGLVYTSPLPDLNSLLEETLKNHPELLLYNYKLDALDIEKKLTFQELLPAIHFRYNQLGKGYHVLKSVNSSFFENNFQYGLTMSLPLRLSQGRGEYRKAKLKIRETVLQQNYKEVQVLNKVKTYYNEYLSLKNQVILQEKVCKNFLALQRGEETRFRNGESSLFLINSRETKTLEAMQKLQELQAKFFKTVASLQWATGSVR